MNQPKVLLKIFLFLGFGLPMASLADTVYTTVQMPYMLESLGHSPRVMAMGSAFAAGEGDASCLFWNPAGLDGLPSAELALDHQEWLSGITQETLLGAFPVAKVGTFAGGINFLNFGSLDGYGPTGDPTTSYHPFRASFSAGYGGTLAHDLSTGIVFRGLFESLTNSDNSFATSFSLGALWRVLPFLRLGAFYSVSTDAAYPDLGTLSLGEAWAIPLFNHAPALLLVDFSLPSNAVYRIEVGFEQPVLTDFFARAGFRQELRDNQIQGFRGFTCGLGVKFQSLEVDYSYIPNGDLGYFQNFGLTFHFPEDQPKTTAAAPAPLATPAPQPALNFTPPEQLTATDKVVQVQVHFDLPKEANPATPTTISPQLQQALDEAGRKVQANPKDAAAWVALGNLYWQAGQPSYTVQSFEEALKLDPTNTQIKAWLDQYQRLHHTPPNP